MTDRTATGTRLAFFLPSLAGGGAERAVLNLAIGFAERGFRSDLILTTAAGPYLSQVPPSVRIVDLEKPRVLRAWHPLAAYLRRERPAALLAAANHANLVAMAASRTSGVRTRTVISIQNTLGKEKQTLSGLRERSIPSLLGRLHPWADAIVAVSKGVADDLARTTRIPRDRIDIVYNPVITPSLPAAAAQRPHHEWFEDAERPIVLGVGRLTRQKNFPVLVDAFARVRHAYPRSRLVILGEGPEKPAIETRIRRHGLEDSVALPGFVENPYACMARSAVLALSSDWEGLPTVLIESLALGTPVVSTDCESGPREILDGGALGELVPPGDARSLADAISRVLDGKRLPAPMDALRPFTLDAVLNRFQDVFGLHA